MVTNNPKMLHSIFRISEKVCFLAIVAWLLVAMPCVAQPHAKQDPRLVLQVAAVFNKTGPTLAFIASNELKDDIRLSGPDASPSAIVIITPGGKTMELFHIADFSPQHTPVVKSGETKTWMIDILAFINNADLNEPGLYRISWRYVLLTPEKELRTVRSNEILVLREKDTPILDPITRIPRVPNSEGK